MAAIETFYDVIRRQGVTRRSFTKFCSLTAASLGLGRPPPPPWRTRWRPSRASR